jgi:hypothetical protein
VGEEGEESGEDARDQRPPEKTIATEKEKRKRRPEVRAAENRSGVHVLGFAVDEGPVLPGGFHQVDDQVLRLEAGRFGEELGHVLEEFAFLLGLAAGAESDLDEDDFVGAPDAEILRVVDEAVVGVFVDDLEAIVGRDGEGVDHGFVDGVGDGAAVFR